MIFGDLPLVAALIRNARKTTINRAMAGHSITRSIGPVLKRDILSYADATLDNPGRYSSSAAAPPFYLSRLVYPMFRYFMINKDLGLNLLRMVHGQQRVEWFGSISEGDMLDINVCINEISGSAAGDTLTLRTTISAAGRLLGVADTLFIVRGRNGRPDKIKNMKPDMSIGRELFRRTIQTEEGQQLKYARVSGDGNFIHTNNFLARLAGLPRTIMHGVCIGAMATNSLLDEVLAGDMSRMKSISMRFANPVLPGEKITLVGYESGLKDRIRFEAFNSKGRPVLKNGEYVFSA